MTDSDRPAMLEFQHESPAEQAAALIIVSCFEQWRKLKPDAEEVEFIADALAYLPTQDPEQLSQRIARLTCQMPLTAVANALGEIAIVNGLSVDALSPVKTVYGYYEVEDVFEQTMNNVSTAVAETDIDDLLTDLNALVGAEDTLVDLTELGQEVASKLKPDDPLGAAFSEST